MGEYAIDQMLLDYKRMNGVDAERSEFEDIKRIRRPSPKCVKCGRLFRLPQAVKDHIRGKHGVTPKVGIQRPGTDPLE